VTHCLESASSSPQDVTGIMSVKEAKDTRPQVKASSEASAALEIPMSEMLMGWAICPGLQILWATCIFTSLFHSWDALKTLLGHHGMICFGSMSAFASVFPFQLGFYYLDTRQAPQILYKHKIQKSVQGLGRKTVGASLEEDYGVAWGHTMGMILSTLPSVSLMAYYMDAGVTDMQNAPDLGWMFLEVFLLSLANEVGFYWSHRLLHVPYFYKRLHKIHHEFKAPGAACGTYSHWIEHQILIAPLFIPVTLAKTHLFTAMLWFFIALTGISLHHSGYELPWTMGDMATQHDLHHEKFNGNFGVYGLFDRLCGTNIDPVTKKMVKNIAKN